MKLFQLSSYSTAVGITMFLFGIEFHFLVPFKAGVLPDA